MAPKRNQEKYDQAIELHKKGTPALQIATEVGLSLPAVYNYIRETRKPKTSSATPHKQKPKQPKTNNTENNTPPTPELGATLFEIIPVPQKKRAALIAGFILGGIATLAVTVLILTILAGHRHCHHVLQWRKARGSEN